MSCWLTRAAPENPIAGEGEGADRCRAAARRTAKFANVTLTPVMVVLTTHQQAAREAVPVVSSGRVEMSSRPGCLS
jgi:hypothetical protein